MHPFLFKIGGFRFPTYGLMIALGYIAGMIYIFRKNRKTRFPSDILSDLVFYTILFGILGGKLFYVLTYWSSFGVTFAAKISYMAPSVGETERVMPGLIFSDESRSSINITGT